MSLAAGRGSRPANLLPTYGEETARMRTNAMAGRIRSMIILIIGLCLIAALITGCFLREKAEKEYMLDGPGMVYEGWLLDEALAGKWTSQDGRYALEIEGFRFSFGIDGEELVEMGNINGFYHGFSGTELTGRQELTVYYPEISRGDETIASIEELWYEDGHIHMVLSFPDDENEEIIFDKEEENQ